MPRNDMAATAVAVLLRLCTRAMARHARHRLGGSATRRRSAKVLSSSKLAFQPRSELRFGHR